MTDAEVILKATFNPKVCTYWLTSGSMIFIMTIIGILLLPLWLLLGLYFTRRYLSRMECVLTRKDLKVHKGIWIREEKTIPLEKITDLGLVQGPIMRHFGIHSLTVETAGQSAQGPLVTLTGVVDVMNFREAVLKQRDACRESAGVAKDENPVTAQSGDSETLTVIKESLLRIEHLLKERN